MRAALSAADAAQETKKEARKTPIAQRAAVARRIEAEAQLADDRRDGTTLAVFAWLDLGVTL